jgi:hypothetical protein
MLCHKKGSTHSHQTPFFPPSLSIFWWLVLCCAVLCCAVLCCAVLCCAVLCCAVLCCAVLCCAVQVRQHVPHKRTFFYLEQIILKHSADDHCVNIKNIHEVCALRPQRSGPHADTPRPTHKLCS